MLTNEYGAGVAQRAGTPEPAPASSDGQRDDPRIPFFGQSFPVRFGGKSCSIRLRDLSCGGASGLCDEPLDVGAFVLVCLGKQSVEAEVRWVRLMNVGLKFTAPLAPGLVRRLQQAHGTFVTARAS